MVLFDKPLPCTPMHSHAPSHGFHCVAQGTTQGPCIFHGTQCPQGLHFSPQNTPTCPGHNHGLSGLTHAIPRASPLRMAFPMPWPGPTQGTTRRSSRAHPVLFRALPRPNQGQPTAHPGPPPGHHQAHQNVVPETIFRSPKQHGIPLVSNSLKLCRVYP